MPRPHPLRLMPSPRSSALAPASRHPATTIWAGCWWPLPSSVARTYATDFGEPSRPCWPNGPSTSLARTLPPQPRVWAAPACMARSTPSSLAPGTISPWRSRRSPGWATPPAWMRSLASSPCCAAPSRPGRSKPWAPALLAASQDAQGEALGGGNAGVDAKVYALGLMRFAARRPVMANPFVHMELMATDVGKAKAFYGQLFDWKLEDIDMGDMTYTMIRVGEGTGGGLMRNPMPNPTSQWVAYVDVGDVEAATRRAKSLGAKVMKEVAEIKGAGKFSIISDPTGAMLGLWQSKKG